MATLAPAKQAYRAASPASSSSGSAPTASGTEPRPAAVSEPCLFDLTDDDEVDALEHFDEVYSWNLEIKAIVLT